MRENRKIKKPHAANSIYSGSQSDPTQRSKTHSSTRTNRSATKQIKRQEAYQKDTFMFRPTIHRSNHHNAQKGPNIQSFSRLQENLYKKKPKTHTQNKNQIPTIELPLNNIAQTIKVDGKQKMIFTNLDLRYEYPQILLNKETKDQNKLSLIGEKATRTYHMQTKFYGLTDMPA